MKCNFRYLLAVAALALSAGAHGYSSDPHLFENRDGYIIGNYLQATDQDIREFFWTGSGDGPGGSVLGAPFERFPISEDAIIRTATVVATVYIDRNEPPDGYDDLCIFDCPPSAADDPALVAAAAAADPVDSVRPTDRRFWLMTVVGGLYGRPDHPLLESRLARLYRVAFARQQALHLGINSSSTDQQPPHNNNTLERHSMDEGGRSKRQVENGKRHTPMGPGSELQGAMASDVLPVPPVVEIIGSAREQPSDSPDGGSGAGHGGAGAAEEPSRSLPPVDGVDAGSGGGGSRTVVRRNPDKGAYSAGRRKSVRILIHNTTHLRDEDRLGRTVEGDGDEGGGATTGRAANNRSGSASERGGRDAANGARQLPNQTEIVYSVFVGGLPVLATTAAEDMRLMMSQDEMEHVLETRVYLKADPYLKEPQATPLIPSTAQNGSGNVTALLGQNSSLLVVSGLAALLLLLLLAVLCAGLFLVARGKRKHTTELKRLESTQALVMPGTIGEELSALRTAREGRPPSAPQPKPRTPTIHFPLPPATRPSSSSTSYSSDSSVYYPKRKQRHQHQQQHQQHQQHHELLDEKAANWSNRLQRQFGALAGGPHENVYASVLPKPARPKEHKRRRKYLGENRVGSFEGGGPPPAPPPRSPLTSTTGSSASPSDEGRQPAPYGPSETLNTDVILKHYLRRKPLAGYGEAGGGLPVEAFNREPGRVRLLMEQCASGGSGGGGGVGGAISVDSGSIGSYLSMASVKSFPRCFVPEPLSRVLEPVTMTHLDQSSDVCAEGAKSTGPDTAATSQYNTDTEGHLARTQSDGADPGVVGPIVWQMHKREMDEIASPMRDPVVTRSRFEGLLEGAMQLYAPEEREEEQKNSIPLPGVIRPAESRGKSAVVVRETSRSSSATMRPVTAAPVRRPDQPRPSEYPPSPGVALGGGGAWTSGTHSPLVRPMSAGPFHSPAGPPVALEVARLTAPHTVLQSTDLSTAPLLHNIMQELKRFRHEQ